MRAPAAVLFDLWGTLIPQTPRAVRDDVAREMAGDLGVDPAAFAAAYHDSYRERFTGATGTLEETVRALAELCGGAPPADAVSRAASRRVELTRRHLRPHESTLRVLDELRHAGLALALVSDSSMEAPEVWPATALSSLITVTAFSCLLGVRKPDPAIYLHAVRGLSVEPGDCLYVGDGGGGELTGAAALGMQVLRIRMPDDGPSDRYDDDLAFAGPEIAGLTELLDLPWARRAT
jgi:putative hydrolase of the HAD superfamily